MEMSQIIAIFDLDYTLTRRGTWGRFVWTSVRTKPHLWLPLLLFTLSFQIQYKRGKVPRGTVKKTMMQWSLMHLKRPELEEIAECFAENEVKQEIRPGGEAALAYHRAQGHRIMIASAAVDLLVEPIARKLNIADFVCTKLAWTDAGVLLEDFASPNCYGQAKLDCVKDWLDKNVEGENAIYFYSDSNADLPVLDYVDYPVVIDPSAKFSKVAMARKMPIQNWMDLKAGFIPIQVKS